MNKKYKSKIYDSSIANLVQVHEGNYMDDDSSCRFYQAQTRGATSAVGNEVERVKKFFNRDNVYKQLTTMVSYLIPGKSNVKLILNIGGGSFTDGKSITVGLPEMFISKSYEEIFTALRALVGHESQHIGSSDFIGFGNFQKEMGKYFNIKYSFNQSYGMKIAKHVANSVEDGRIEKILCNKFVGYTKHIQFLNGTIWEAQEIKGNSELGDFLYTITTLSVTGLYPKGYKKLYKGTELDKNIKMIKKDINRGINAVKSKKCFSICGEIMIKVEDYLAKLFEKKSKEDQEFMDNMPDDAEYTTSEETETNSNRTISTHFKPEDDEKDEDKEENEGEGSKDEKTSDDEKKDGKGSGEKDKDDKSDDDKSEDGEKGKGDKDSKDSKESKDGKDSSKSKSSSKPDKSSDEKSDSSEADPEDLDFDDEQAIKDKMKELEEDVIKDAKEKLTEKKETKNKKKEQEEGLNLDEIRALETKYKDERVRSFQELRGFPLVHSLPVELKREGLKFKKEIEKILRNKEAYTLKGQKRGMLEVNDIFKIGLKEYNIFTKKGAPTTTDYCAFMLQDGSGSMSCENKQFYSASALAIMEEGLKGVIPFKTSTFTVGSHNYRSGIIHYSVKEFNENNRDKNYAYNFYKHRHAGGGNKDGYSIRVATQELLKRPEKDKMLFILSDGIPTDYTGGEKEGMVDVKKAVKDARAKGIHVFALMFGEQGYRDASIEKYKYMYEKNIISCSPDRITAQLTKIMKSILSR